MKIAVDLGGTNIRMAKVQGEVVSNKLSVACRAQEDAEVVLNQIADLIAQGMDPGVDGIGIGVPSVVDAKRGVVYSATNISAWKEVPLKQELEARFGVPVRVNNDCNCFALAESRYGAGRPYAHLLGITLGTGVGTGVVINKKLYGGVCTGAGEIGSLPYRESDFEHHCSSYFFKAHGTTGAEAYKKAMEGSQEARQLWDEFGRNIGQLIKAVLFTYAPEAVVLGGGIVPAMPLFQQAMRQEVADFPYEMISAPLAILQGGLPDASLLGAALLFEEECV